VTGVAGDTGGPFFLPAAVDSGGRTVILVEGTRKWNSPRALPNGRPFLQASATPLPVPRSPVPRPLARSSQERQENTPGIIKFFRGPRKQTLIAPSASAIFSPSHPPCPLPPFPVPRQQFRFITMLFLRRSGGGGWRGDREGGRETEISVILIMRPPLTRPRPIINSPRRNFNWKIARARCSNEQIDRVVVNSSLESYSNSDRVFRPLRDRRYISN